MLKYSVGVSTRVSHYLGKEGCSKLFHISKGKSIMHLFIGLGLGVVSTNNVDGLFNGSDRVQGGVGSYVPSLPIGATPGETDFVSRLFRSLGCAGREGTPHVSFDTRS